MGAMMRKDAGDSRCPVCGNEARRGVIRRYRYSESGLDHVYLANSVVRYHCPNHGKVIHIPSEQQLLQVLALALLEQSSLLGPKEIKYLRKACDLTQAEMARLLGLRGHATVAERELGRSRLTNETDFFYRAIVARELWNLHLKKPGRSFLAPIHVVELRKKLEHFTDSLARSRSRKTSSLQLELGDHAWLKAA